MLITYTGKHASVHVIVNGTPVSANYGDTIEVANEIADALSVLPGWDTYSAPVLADEPEEV